MKMEICCCYYIGTTYVALIPTRENKRAHFTQTKPANATSAFTCAFSSNGQLACICSLAPPD